MATRAAELDIATVVAALEVSGITGSVSVSSEGTLVRSQRVNGVLVTTSEVVSASTKVDNASNETTAQAVLDGIGAWTLSADGTDGSADITVTGPDAVVAWTVLLDGKEIASETDTTGPFELVLSAPVTPGSYSIRAIATDGTATGSLDLEVT